MERQSDNAVSTKDSMNDIAQVITFLGVAVGARSLDEYERGGASTALEWAAERLRDSSNLLLELVHQEGSTPN